jgi:hypothetical protein
MEKEIRIIVNVSEEEHADVIRDDIIAAIKIRTPNYYVGIPKKPNTSIEDSRLQDKFRIIDK